MTAAQGAAANVEVTVMGLGGAMVLGFAALL